MNSKTILKIIILAAVFVGGFAAANFHIDFSSSKIPSDSNKKGEYKFINPVVLADIDKHFIVNFQPLRDEIRSIAEKYPQKTYVYFSYLNNGSWIGINERENFAAASLAKVPLSMSIYKAVEDKKLELGQFYTIEELDLNSGFGELYKNSKDRVFSIEELIKIMLEQSDNTALNGLLTVFSRIGINNPYDEVYQAFGWVLDMDKSVNANEINLKTLSNMFLSLYNANFISLENSEKILEYLSNTPFEDKIVAGVPENIVVSHKIGISGGNSTFSDCGIIYAPQRHYLLCLGSNGGEESKANKFMEEISEATYKFVINN